MRISHFFIGAALAVSATSASAAISLTFPGVGAQYFSATNGGGVLAAGGVTTFAWTTGDYVKQSFSATGLASAGAAAGSFQIENVLNLDLTLGLEINGVEVGQILILDSNYSGEVQTVSYDFTFASIVGDDYDLALVWKNTIPDGDGSIRVFEGGTIRLTEGGAVPEPASWAMMIAGFGLVGGVLRRRTTAVA
jgi:hypothetical protein